MKKLNVVVFSGGRGASNILYALSRHPQVSLTVVVNAYDDGLSTGRLRSFIPGMLGPSDVRKNICTLIDRSNKTNKALFDLLEYRFPMNIDTQVAVDTINYFDQPERAGSDPFVDSIKKELQYGVFLYLARALQNFYKYYIGRLKEGVDFDFRDASLGNIVFSGVYLASNHSFNAAIDDFSEALGIQSKVLNATDGSNRVLVGIKEDGEYLYDESSIVSPQTKTPIEAIYLLKQYIQGDELSCFNQLSKNEKMAKLSRINSVPETNTLLRALLQTAEIIIYGPGTQHSSLFPTYIQPGIGSAIAQNIYAQKIFVVNISHDHDIQELTVDDLLNKFLYYINQYDKTKYKLTDVVSRLLVNQSQLHEGCLLFNNRENYESVILEHANWSDKDGKHAIGKLSNHILQLAQNTIDTKLRPYRHTVTIIIPILNEITTLAKVYEDAKRLSFERYGLNKEIIFVDGGSTDGSYQYLKNAAEFEVMQSTISGRGAALKVGIQQASGEIIVFFPADDEYVMDDIYKLVSPIVHHDFSLVVGSRSIKSDELRAVLKRIYGKNYLMMLSSFLGNHALSFLSLFHGRYMSDMTSSVLAFDRSLIASNVLKSKDIDINVELYVLARKNRAHILEVPVAFEPRHYRSGKKTGLFNGLKSLIRFTNA